MDYNAPATPSSPSREPIRDKVGPPSRPTGPNASAIILGLVAMLLAGLVIARETMDLTVDWSRLGPGTIIGLGVVMVVIGAVGLVRRRHDDP
jgi:hypothetical protein